MDLLGILEVFRVLDDGLLDRHPLALCSTGTGSVTDETGPNGDASTARWPPVECPRDFVTWKHKEGRPERPAFLTGVTLRGLYKWHQKTL